MKHSKWFRWSAFSSKVIGLFPLILALVSTASGQATNQTSATDPLSLSSARRLALQRNWDLLAAHSGIDSAQAQLMVAKEFPNPSLSLSTARIGDRQNSTVQGNSLWNRNYDTIAAVSQLLEIAGKRSSRRESAHAGVSGARARFLDARRTLEQGVAKAYVAALLAEENARILSASAKSLRRQAEIAQARFQAGDISASDLKQIQNNAQDFELQAGNAVMTAAQARIGLELLLGVPSPQGKCVLEEKLDTLAFNQTASPVTVPDGSRPDVLAAEADLKRAGAELKLQKALRLPDPVVSVGVEHNPPGGGPPTDSFILGVTLPLPLWNRNGGAIRAAEAAEKQAVLVLEKSRAQAFADLATAEVAYQEASERSRRYRDEIQPRSAQVRDSVEYAYGKGGASLVDLLTAERDYNNVRLSTARALSDAAGAAADLEAARDRVTRTQLASVK